MVRASTQQTVDRFVGTAAVLGLSVLFFRWSRPYFKRRRRSRHEWTNSDGKFQQQKDENPTEIVTEENDDHNEEYEHQGSCHCSSIIFVLRGPQRLKAVDSPGKIRYPHIQTSADRFRLIRGESDMRFYYEEDKNDDSSSITFDHVVIEEQQQRSDNSISRQESALGAHVFCGNCGVHVFHADRTTGELEVNANCLDSGDDTTILRSENTSSFGDGGPYSIAFKKQGKRAPLSRSSHSSLSSTMENAESNNVEKLANKNLTIETVSETEPYLGSATSTNNLDQQQQHKTSSIPRKESCSSDPTANSESYSATMIATEGEDSSMGSSSITGASAPLYHTLQSAASFGGDGMDRARALPPLPPSRMSSSDRSVKTLPAQFGERRYTPRGGVGGGGGVSSSWSLASMESNDLDGDHVRKSTISPKMRDQMKKYMQKYT
eukprot:CAMPEP_0183712964 /NCGR_PEP_ID=MMETSP0737-20130205/7987_1 /TAXON_ID=385413 /ORGANISM="Thalassiosira miniscula, Strain CCMP1093" /LENGTH=434 /DNA_ID=CAMNT_0025941705 /DNA_START=411 /DNA_END=1715 /DNA_ORIENTATION=+